MTQQYTDGWVRLDDSVYVLGAFWLNGFDPIEDPERRRLEGRGPDGRSSPIYDYVDGGIGKVQWLNVTLNRAAILAADGSWKTGGEFHLWVSLGAGTRPFEIKSKYPIKIDAGDPRGWHDRKQEAISEVEKILGLRHPQTS